VEAEEDENEEKEAYEAHEISTSVPLRVSVTPGGEGATPYQTGLTDTSFTDPQTDGTTYYYTVTAVYASGEGAQSNETSAAAEFTTPDAPSNLTATPNGSLEIDLSWTPATGADRYIIEQSTDGTNFIWYDQVPASQTTYQDLGASDGSTYYYQVYAVNAVGNSASTSSASASTPLAAPDTLVATAASSTEIDLTWENNSAAATGFTIERSTGGGAFDEIDTVTGSTTTSYADQTTLSPGNEYQYEVIATSSTASSAPCLSTTLYTLPANVTDLLATNDIYTGGIKLTWTDVTGATSYEIDRQDSNGVHPTNA
jgi:hypothetical protein